jgi:hypothetical protein
MADAPAAVPLTGLMAGEWPRGRSRNQKPRRVGEPTVQREALWIGRGTSNPLAAAISGALG